MLSNRVRIGAFQIRLPAQLRAGPDLVGMALPAIRNMAAALMRDDLARARAWRCAVSRGRDHAAVGHRRTNAWRAVALAVLAVGGLMQSNIGTFALFAANSG